LKVRAATWAEATVRGLVAPFGLALFSTHRSSVLGVKLYQAVHRPTGHGTQVIESSGSSSESGPFSGRFCIVFRDDERDRAHMRISTPRRRVPNNSTRGAKPAPLLPELSDARRAALLREFSQVVPGLFCWRERVQETPPLHATGRSIPA